MLGALGRDGVGSSLGGGDPSARGYRAAVCGRRHRGVGGVRALLALGLFSRDRRQEGRPALAFACRVPALGRPAMRAWPREQERVHLLLASGVALRADLSLSSPGNPHWRQCDVLNGGLVGVKGFLNLTQMDPNQIVKKPLPSFSVQSAA